MLWSLSTSINKVHILGNHIKETYKNINLDQLEEILINNNRTIKIYLEKVDQAIKDNRNKPDIPNYETFENYRETKAKLFQKLDKDSKSVINIDDNFGKKLSKQMWLIH